MIPTNFSLHLRYRLWIADLNADITILRILDDAIRELRTLGKEHTLLSKASDYEQQFINYRREIDDLKHEMHLMKMKMAANSREIQPGNKLPEENHHQEVLEQKYSDFRQRFEQLKNGMLEFETQLKP